MPNAKKVLLWVSLSLNALTVIAIAYLTPKALDIMAAVDDVTGNYIQRRRDAINASQVKRTEILFLGDSITHEGIWEEYLPGFNVVNHAVSGDTTVDLLDRVERELRLQPEKLFLMIGINDLNAGYPVAEITRRYDMLFAEIDSALPEAEIYIQSVLPTNDDWIIDVDIRDVSQLNEHLKQEAEARDFHFVDLRGIFSNPDGQLRTELSNDGIHLVGEGYAVWSRKLRTLLAQTRSTL